MITVYLILAIVTPVVLLATVFFENYTLHPTRRQRHSIKEMWMDEGSRTIRQPSKRR